MKKCACGHLFEDHEPVAEGMLPFCRYCSCTAPREVAQWIRDLLDLLSRNAG